MKAQQLKTTSTQQLISDVVNYYAVLETQTPNKAVFHSPSPDGYPKYLDRENDPYCRLKRPNPPTPEAVAQAQFVDKTYVWQEPGKETKPS
jgi:hypothetical protein